MFTRSSHLPFLAGSLGVPLALLIGAALAQRASQPAVERPRVVEELAPALADVKPVSGPGRAEADGGRDGDHSGTGASSAGFAPAASAGK